MSEPGWIGYLERNCGRGLTECQEDLDRTLQSRGDGFVEILPRHFPYNSMGYVSKPLVLSGGRGHRLASQIDSGKLSGAKHPLEQFVSGHTSQICQTRRDPDICFTASTGSVLPSMDRRSYCNLGFPRIRAHRER